MNISLIYATWPNRPNGIGWHKLAGAMREAGLTQQLVKAGYKVTEHILEAEGPAASELKAAFALSAKIGAAVKASHEVGSLAVILCGSCSVAAVGALSGMGGETGGICWMDAHPDLNTPETTLSGLFEGMALSIGLGNAWQTMAFDIAGINPISLRHLCFYGVRAPDDAEQATIEDEGLPILDEADDIISHLADCERVYIHIDMDVHDAAELRVNSFSGNGGPSVAKVRQDLAAIAAALPITAIAITGIDPKIGGKQGAMDCAIGHIEAVCDSRKQAAG